jgi:hypothetical protein
MLDYEQRIARLDRTVESTAKAIEININASEASFRTLFLEFTNEVFKHAHQYRKKIIVHSDENLSTSDKKIM